MAEEQDVYNFIGETEIFWGVKKYIFTFFLFTLFICFAKAQMFDVNKPFFKGEDFFRPEFIKKNKIHTMFGEINTKQSMQIIKNQHLLQHYTFNNNGQLEKYTYTYYNGNKIDTNVIFYVQCQILPRLIFK